MSGTIGLADAGLLTGGSYSLGGGFRSGATRRAASGLTAGEAGVGPPRFPAPSGRLPILSVIERSSASIFPQAQVVRVSLYDAAGRLARTLADEPLPAGRHRRVWDGADDRGRPLAAGIYFVRFEGKTAQVGEKVVLLR